jgi:hypothetical protein
LVSDLADEADAILLNNIRPDATVEVAHGRFGRGRG